jgi:hypothetical protein
LRKEGREELKPSNLLKAAKLLQSFLANGIVSYYDPFTQEVELRTMNQLRESWGEDGLDAFFRRWSKWSVLSMRRKPEQTKVYDGHRSGYKQSPPAGPWSKAHDQPNRT